MELRKMTALRDLARQIETPSYADSKVDEIKGKNVRGPSLVPGEMYIAKAWKPTVEGSDNVYFAVKFLEAVALVEDSRQRYEDNPRLIDMKAEDRYVFERCIDGRNTEMLAFRHDDCLCFGESNVRITFYSINAEDADGKLENKGRKKAATKGARKQPNRRLTAKKAAAPEEVASNADATEAAADISGADTLPADEATQATSDEPTADTSTTAGHDKHEEFLADDRPEAEAELERREDAEREMAEATSNS
jgi:hypothetical protein